MKTNRISNRELDVMNVFWEKESPLIASEIVSANPELNISTVQASLKKLIEKGYVQVSDIVHSGKVLTRRYEAIKSPDEYVVDEIGSVSVGVRKKKPTMKIFSSLLNGEQCEKEILDELDRIVKQKRRKLE